MAPVHYHMVLPGQPIPEFRRPSILKCSPDDLLIEDANQKIRIYDAEDKSTWPDWVHTKRTDKIRKFV